MLGSKVDPQENYDVQFDRPPFIKSVLLPELNDSAKPKEEVKRISLLQGGAGHNYSPKSAIFIC